MWKSIAALTTLLLMVSVWFVGYLLREPEVDRSPPWHPFELNSNLTLESIVSNGYRLSGAPCGMFMFAKEMGDTTIVYGVNIDCNPYDGKYDPNDGLMFIQEDTIELLNEEEMIPILVDSADSTEDYIDDVTDSKSPKWPWADSILVNPYFPWQKGDFDGCYQKIGDRAFTINLGDTFDSVAIARYIGQNDGVILDDASNWSQENGGHILVYYHPTDLYFLCSIRHPYDERIENLWEFVITRSIPKLDQGALNLEKERDQKIEAYYD